MESASDIIDNDSMTVTATNRQHISSKTMEKEQSAISGAITAVRAITPLASRINIVDTQTSFLSYDRSLANHDRPSPNQFKYRRSYM